MVFWDDLGFATNYTMDADPEYPGNGQWGMPVVELTDGASLPTPGPIAVIHPADGEPWVLSVGFSGLGQLFGSPDPDMFCVVERYGRFVWVDARTRQQQKQSDLGPVHVAAAVDHGLLLVAGARSITAIDARGVRWSAVDLVGEDLHITRSDGDRIYYRGLDFVGDGTHETRGSLHSQTGEPA